MAIEEQVLRDIALTDLHKEVQVYHNRGFRLVQVSCSMVEDSFELSYSFDKDLHFESLRVMVPAGTVVKSISGIYWAAFIYENEIHDFFGLEFEGMSLDYNGTLFKTAKKFPFANVTFRGEEPCQRK
ncbi:ech hydrogenase subunit D [Methanofollis sp. W23]|uniref:NADH-quinone oxidoreductase subunit C n=1 Tax=Methanofollis sp. W23 TaxID=2817849 RepID=UPI001AE7D817|nr:NADH-quinone oxidoreductase subunit C [Methanofollis sp. W23]MBP2145575.1 ech hydrogenase subunit D [Methanofollis sp. W23]